MKIDTRINNEPTQINANIGIKIGHSMYVVCAFDSPHDKADIIDFFMASNIENAIKEAVSYDFFKEKGYINLITGDGQVCYITIPEVE